MNQAWIIAWLAVCAWQDWKSRQVSNWLTLLPLLLALSLRLSGYAEGASPLLELILAGVLVAWLGRWIGGADAKVLAALALLDTRLALWAWLGAAAWYTLLLAYSWFVAQDRNTIRLPGMLGFLIGAGAHWLWL